MCSLGQAESPFTGKIRQNHMMFPHERLTVLDISSSGNLVEKKKNFSYPSRWIGCEKAILIDLGYTCP